jgi:hypothetical protein
MLKYVPWGKELTEGFYAHGEIAKSDKTNQNYLPSSLGKGWAALGEGNKFEQKRWADYHAPFGEDRPPLYDDPRSPLDGSEGREWANEQSMARDDIDADRAGLTAQDLADEERVGKFESYKKREDARRAGTNAGLRATFGLSPQDPIKKPDAIKEIEKRLSAKIPWKAVNAADAEEIEIRIGKVTQGLTALAAKIHPDTPDDTVDSVIKKIREISSLEKRIGKSKSGGKSRTVLLKRLSASEAQMLEILGSIEGLMGNPLAPGVTPPVTQAQTPPVQQSDF